MNSNRIDCSNPILDRRPEIALRDPAIVQQDGEYIALFTQVDCSGERTVTSLATARSENLCEWTTPRTVANGPEMFCAPGNVIRHDGEWVCCLQSYPIPPGATCGDETARLYLMRSDDLRSWSEPSVVESDGASVQWADSPRQIDPFLLEHDDRYWCFYKTAGKIGLLVSDDLTTWTEAAPETPILGPAETPDGATIENPWVFRQDGNFRMLFSPCREGRGIGVARSSDLQTWSDVQYVSFPDLDWAPNGPTAPCLIDHPGTPGEWTMVFHGEDTRRHPHGAALGVAWSDDLETWSVPCNETSRR